MSDIFNPGSPSLAPSYQNIISGLQGRAQIEAKTPTPYDAVTPIIQRIDQELTKQRDFELKMAGEGRTQFTFEMAEELGEELGVPPETFAKAVNRYFGEDEFTKMIDNAMMPQGMAELQASDALTPAQKSTAKATGEDGRRALAANMFPKPSTSSGRQNVRLEIDGDVYEVPNEVYAAATALAQETGRPYTDFINLSAFGKAGYKATTTKSPQTGEVINVTPGGKVRQMTGPQPIPEGGKLDAWEKLNANDFQRLDKEAKEVLGDPVIKAIREQRSQLGNIRQILNSGIKQGIGPLQSNLARYIANEKGVLTEQDVMRNTGSRALADRFGRFIKMASEGKMTDDDVKGFNDLLNIIEQRSELVKNDTIDGFVDRMIPTLQEYKDVKGNRVQIDPSFIRKRFDVPAPTGSGGSKIVGRRANK